MPDLAQAGRRGNQPISTYTAECVGRHRMCSTGRALIRHEVKLQHAVLQHLEAHCKLATAPK